MYRALGCSDTIVCQEICQSMPWSVDFVGSELNNESRLVRKRANPKGGWSRKLKMQFNWKGDIGIVCVKPNGHSNISFLLQF